MTQEVYFFLLLIGAIFILATLVEIYSMLLCGKILKENEADCFFEKNKFEKYVKGGKRFHRDGCILFGKPVKNPQPFISNSVRTPLSKWRINGVGRISRFSKWSVRLDSIAM